MEAGRRVSRTQKISTVTKQTQKTSFNPSPRLNFSSFFVSFHIFFRNLILSYSQWRCQETGLKPTCGLFHQPIGISKNAIAHLFIPGTKDPIHFFNVVFFLRITTLLTWLKQQLYYWRINAFIQLFIWKQMFTDKWDAALLERKMLEKR